ncbi:serine O-acetyltransferase [Aphanothece sacrum]|uniref:Serine acetyltransferase n=1 Tax=Aphanothece sacrum FPU1 TaxID=1920663 RepID=A0A401IKT0_APHSA|nr:serine O-acetyltransferase [Aphanothece sacrum]GBF81851.1 serine acetyltransferase [Aphanothece sacrum FPU1]GBF85670.1 serine acetyltransferase [Aphanothece sacrum FPU3]
MNTFKQFTNEETSVWDKPQEPSLSRNLLNTIKADFEAIFAKDPSARSWFEVLTCYPGFQALLVYRIAHIFHQCQFYWLARFISYLARWLTCIEIHPGAKLGRGIFIDHGMGVVIGETAIIGDDVLIYQGVTLGGTGKQQGKRHPTLGNNVIVGAGAKVLGDIFIGDNTRIGAGSVTLCSVDNDCTVVGIPGRIVRRSGQKVDPLAHSQIPDPVADQIESLIQRIEQLEKPQQISDLQWTPFSVNSSQLAQFREKA